MVDTKCIFPNGKCKKKCALNSEDLDEDESLLKQPLRTSCAGFREAKKAYENGTDEVRRLLVEECSLIYECNVCRNMFRSLANFISHKRHYCKSRTSENIHHFSEQSSSMFIHTVEKSEPFKVKSRSTGCSPIPNSKSSNRDLSKVIERLKRVEVSPGSIQRKTSDMNCKTELSSPEPDALDPVLELERVPTTTNAVYQTLKTNSDIDSIKTEIDEVHNLLTNKNIFLGPDGKTIISPAFVSSKINTDKILEENHCETPQITTGISCEICKMPFQTEKTLNMHVQKNHTSTTYVFQCPSCSMTFLQPAAVIRHLANEHKKPLRRIRKMRDTIFKKRIQIGDAQIKGLDGEVKRLQMTNTKDIDGSNLLVLSCSYCFKNFERRAALATHLINCVARKTSLKNIELSKKVRHQNEQNNDAKFQNQISKQGIEHIQNNTSNLTTAEYKTETKVTIKQEPQEDRNLIKNSLNINKLFENLEKQTFGNGLHTVCLENIEMTEQSKQKTGDIEEEQDVDNRANDCCDNKSDEKKTIENVITNRDKSIKKEKAKRFRIVSTSKQLNCRCKICNKQFNALSNLRRHISMFHYRSKRFGCNLCDYRAFRSYDIVNHLTFVHKMTGERETMAVEYVTVHEIKYSKDDVEGDIVVISDEAIVSDHYRRKEQQLKAGEQKTLTYEMREKNKKSFFKAKQDSVQPLILDTINLKDKSHVKVVRRKFKKALETQGEGKNRPIRNRIKTVNNDFVYDLLTIKEENKQTPRFAIKRTSNTVIVDPNNVTNVELTPPPIKITPYRLRTESLMPADKSCIKGTAANVCRNVIHGGLAAPSTLPELPTERPQMRSRLISSSRSDTNTVPIIGTSELEAAGLKSTFFDDSFLEKFAKKSNPSFKMKPLLAMQHSPLNSILQKFDASQQNNVKTIGNGTLIKSITQPSLKEKDLTPNGKLIFEPSSPPVAPRKRITLMERLAENRAKRRDCLIRNALEN